MRTNFYNNLTSSDKALYLLLRNMCCFDGHITDDLYVEIRNLVIVRFSRNQREKEYVAMVLEEIVDMGMGWRIDREKFPIRCDTIQKTKEEQEQNRYGYLFDDEPELVIDARCDSLWRALGTIRKNTEQGAIEWQVWWNGSYEWVTVVEK